MTAMVGEFPELQGTMGKYYALAQGESAELAQAIEEHYRPRYAGDALPITKTGQALALAPRRPLRRRKPRRRPPTALLNRPASRRKRAIRSRRRGLAWC